MKIVFLSNFLNLHQLPLCMTFHNKENVDFTFVATEKVPEYRLAMKYEDLNNEYSFVLRSYDGKESEALAYMLTCEADIVIIGSAPNDYIEDRLKKFNKLTFRFCERPLKKGTWRRYIPCTRYRIFKDYLKYKNDKLYILGASAYTAYDINICGFPQEKCFKWGYFPEFVKYKNTEEILQQKKQNSILWTGRFIQFKHPDEVIRIAKELKRLRYRFSVKMIGDGPLRPRIEKLIKEYQLEDVVRLVGVLSNYEVRAEMERSDIFLFTSDYYEGWGAVVNEAMNSLCVPIVSHACGSAAFLIEQGKNGFIYRYGNNSEAVMRIAQLFENKKGRIAMGKCAYSSLEKEWNAEVAASRLIEFSNTLIKEGQYTIYQSGPCSRAPVLKNNWYKR